ncbi:MAG TPA: zinc ABC transporter substrate-binding protein, partial [Burkholderiales bacterium]
MKWLFFPFAIALSTAASAAVNVFACEPEWAALAHELGGDKVSAVSATTAFQDPHHIEARPSLIARLRNANLVVCSGSQLEVGWLPLLLQQSGNARVQPGSPGYL